MIGSGIQSDFLTDVARGAYQDKTPFGGSGEKSQTGPGSGVIWSNGAFAIPAAAGIQMEVKSSDAADDLTGANVRTIEIHYLDNTLTPQTEFVNMDGLTPVLTTATNIRFVQEIHAHVFGTVFTAAGNITIAPVGGGQVYGEILAGKIRGSSTAKMVPAGKRCLLYGAVAGSISGTAAAGTIIKIVASELDEFQYLDPLILLPYGSLAYQDISFGMFFPVPFVFSEGTVVAMTYENDKTAIISGLWFGILEDASP